MLLHPKQLNALCKPHASGFLFKTYTLLPSTRCWHELKLAFTTLRDIFLSVCLRDYAFGASPLATSDGANISAFDDWTITEEASDLA